MRCHPKDWQHPGRIKVQIFDELGNAVHPKITSKKLLFQCICDMLPNHKARKEAPPKEEIEKKRSEFLASQVKERIDRQKEFNKKGIRTNKKKQVKAQ